jgi:hypothetical protein
VSPKVTSESAELEDAVTEAAEECSGECSFVVHE